MIGSPQQEAIWAAVADSTANVAVQARAGCLAADTALHINRAGKGSRMTIQKVAMQLAGTPPRYVRSDNGATARMRPWDLGIPTYVARADGPVARLAHLRSAWYSGPKETFRVTTETGRSIRATAIHPFLVEGGHWIQLADLRPGMRLQVSVGRGVNGRGPKIHYHTVRTRHHPNQVSRGCYLSVLKHHAVVEAAMNRLGLDEFLRIVRRDPERAATLAYLPSGAIVHHIDRDTGNNALSNLVALNGQTEHAGFHAWAPNVLWQIGLEVISSVTPHGVEHTFDVEVADEPHNFLANGFVVHNTGKTTTLVECLHRCHDPELRSGFLAFNRHIAQELGRRVPQGVSACTLHSLGMRAVRSALKVQGEPDGRKLDKLAKELAPGLGYPARTAAAGLARLCKYTLSDPADRGRLWDLVGHYGIDLAGRPDDVFDLAAKLVPRSRAMHGVIDFDDMIDLPVALKLDVEAFDLLMLDEAQDTSPLQQELAVRASRGGRLVIVGDARQAIYGFAGADVSAIPNLVARLHSSFLGVEEYPLTVTRRCPHSHVALVRPIVADLEALPEAPAGSVEEVGPEAVAAQAQPGDLVVCRNNAPVLSVAFGLIARGVKTIVRGRDVGKGLLRLIEQLRPETVRDLLRRLAAYRSEETLRLAQEEGTEEAIQSLADRCDCLQVLAQGATCLEEIERKVDTLFADVDDPRAAAGSVVCSSIHRAKGLESDTVWVVAPELIPGKAAVRDWQVQQERNLAYVAATRSKRRLVFAGEVPAIYGRPQAAEQLVTLSDLRPATGAVPQERIFGDLVRHLPPELALESAGWRKVRPKASAEPLWERLGRLLSEAAALATLAGDSVPCPYCRQMTEGRRCWKCSICVCACGTVIASPFLSLCRACEVAGYRERGEPY